LAFVESVQDEFHGLDLANDPSHRGAVVKNMKRETALYVSERDDGPIVGAVMYSPRSRHIGWLAVAKRCRRHGAGRALVEHVINSLSMDAPIRVRTFMESDPPGPTAHAFYRSLGFEMIGVEEDMDHLNAGRPFCVFVLQSK
jgi:ribosomal protein S18 acetylase RimI-like enzyme